MGKRQSITANQKRQQQQGKKRSFKEMNENSPFPPHLIKQAEVTPSYSMFDGHNQEKIKENVENGVKYLRFIYSEPPKKRRRIKQDQGVLSSLRKNVKKAFCFLDV